MNIRTPTLLAVTPINKTEGLPDGRYTTVNPGGVPFRPQVEFKNGQWPTLHEWEVSYLRPLPEGAVPVIEVDIAEFLWPYVLDAELCKEAAKQFIQTKLAQMGEGK